MESNDDSAPFGIIEPRLLLGRFDVAEGTHVTRQSGITPDAYFRSYSRSVCKEIEPKNLYIQRFEFILFWEFKAERTNIYFSLLHIEVPGGLHLHDIVDILIYDISG